MNSTSLSRFVEAQDKTYEQALRELNAGRKQTHWMWFVFPQIRGLGSTEVSLFFGVEDKNEARAYLEHPLLRERLVTATLAVLRHTNLALTDIFPFPDDLKFISCMTLFACIPRAPPEFDQAIKRFADGKRDLRTIGILERSSS